MAAITWSESLSVKIESIDDQHKKLIEMINDFYENISKRTNNENIIVLIDGMKKYTIEHFSYEERYMKQFGYPEYEQHKQEHDNFIARVTVLEEKFKKGTIILSYEITSFLKDWIKYHIQNSDMKYTSFFKNNGMV